MRLAQRLEEERYCTRREIKSAGYYQKCARSPRHSSMRTRGRTHAVHACIRLLFSVIASFDGATAGHARDRPDAGLITISRSSRISFTRTLAAETAVFFASLHPPRRLVSYRREQVCERRVQGPRGARHASLISLGLACGPTYADR